MRVRFPPSALGSSVRPRSWLGSTTPAGTPEKDFELSERLRAFVE